MKLISIPNSFFERDIAKNHEGRIMAQAFDIADLRVAEDEKAKTHNADRDIVAASTPPTCNCLFETTPELATQGLDAKRSQQSAFNGSPLVTSRPASRQLEPSSASPTVSCNTLSHGDPLVGVQRNAPSSGSLSGRSAVSTSSQARKSRLSFGLLAHRKIENTSYSLASLVVMVKIHSGKPDPLAKAWAREAYARTISDLVLSWHICGTWLGLAFVNSKFGRIMVVKAESLLQPGQLSISDQLFGNKERTITVAVELSSGILAASLVDLSDFLSDFDLFPLIPHDLSESTNSRTGWPSFNMETDNYCYSIPSVQCLYGTFRVGLNILSDLPWDGPLKRLSPPGEDFLAYANTLISRAKVYERTNGPLQDAASLHQDLPGEPARKRRRVYNSRCSESGSSESSSTLDPPDGSSASVMPSLSADCKAALEDRVRSWNEKTTGEHGHEPEIEVEENTFGHTVETKIKLLIVTASEMDQLLEFRACSKSGTSYVH